jgi:undecaprenyl-diphosphatase
VSGFCSARLCRTTTKLTSAEITDVTLFAHTQARTKFFARNIMTLFEQFDRALALYANQFAGHSFVLDKFVFDTLDTSLLNSGVVLAAYWWLWFEADESGVCAQRRNVVVALLAVIVVASAAWLLKVLLPFRHPPLSNPGFGLRLPFGVDPTSLNYLSSFPSGHAMLFFALSVPLWMRSRWLGAAATIWILLAICLPLLYLGYHWPSDIVAGAVVGVALMLLLCRLISATRLPDRVVRFSATHSPAFYAIAWLVALEIAVRFGDVEAFSSDAASLARALLF